MLKKLILLIIFLPTMVLAELPKDSSEQLRIRPHQWAVPIIGSKLDNLYQVDKGIYRSEQPNKKALSQVSQL